MKPKKLIQEFVRSGHKLVLTKPLPEQVAIYFHALDPSEHRAFRDAILYFQSQGFRSVDAREFVDGTGSRLFLSFDDNYRSWRDLMPLMGDLGVTATFYTNSGVFRDRSSDTDRTAYFDRLNYHGERITLTTEQLREIRAAGHTIGAHTHLHFDLGSISEDEARREIELSKTVLEEILGEQVPDFSFPFGMRRNFSAGLRRYCLDIGFETVADATPGMQFAGQKKSQIHRSVWHFEDDFDYNLQNVLIDGSFFERITGRSAVG